MSEVENWITERIVSAASTSEPRLAKYVYAIVDGSRQPMVIPAALDAYSSNFRCLYSGNALAEFGDNAAWVVELKLGESTLNWLVTHGLNRRWAIFATSQLEISAFIRHLKKFTVTVGPDGRTLFFRFYDPHVLRQYLPVFDERQTQLLFSGVGDLFLEDTSGRNALIKYDLGDDGTLNMSSVF